MSLRHVAALVSPPGEEETERGTGDMAEPSLTHLLRRVDVLLWQALALGEFLKFFQSFWVHIGTSACGEESR